MCHVILQDHVIIWSCDFMGKSHSSKVIIQGEFVAIGIVVVEMFLVCHMISQNDLIILFILLFDFMGKGI